MIDERIVYYLLCTFFFNVCMYYFLIWKPDEYFFAFDYDCNDKKERRNYLLMVIVILCFFLDIGLSEGCQLPAIINESHQIVKGTIIKKEEWEKNHKDIVYGKLKIIS